jgi:hypothetical protein
MTRSATCERRQVQVPVLKRSFLLPICGNIPKAILRRSAAKTIWLTTAQDLRRGPDRSAAAKQEFPELGTSGLKCGTFGASYGRIPTRTGSKSGRQATAGRSQGRGLMASGQSIGDAKHHSVRAVVFDRAPALVLLSVTGGSAALRSGAHGALSLEPFVSRGKPTGRPACRLMTVGARRRGVTFYGYKAHAGGWHPPGRNTDCRH